MAPHVEKKSFCLLHCHPGGHFVGPVQPWPPPGRRVSNKQVRNEQGKVLSSHCPHSLDPVHTGPLFGWQRYCEPCNVLGTIEVSAFAYIEKHVS